MITIFFLIKYSEQIRMIPIRIWMPWNLDFLWEEFLERYHCRREETIGQAASSVDRCLLYLKEVHKHFIIWSLCLTLMLPCYPGNIYQIVFIFFSNGILINPWTATPIAYKCLSHQTPRIALKHGDQFPPVV